MANPTRIEICCADHDHSLGMQAVPPCVNGAKEAIIELTDAEIAELDALTLKMEQDHKNREIESTRVASLKESAKAKLIAGEPLTAEEASVIVL